MNTSIITSEETTYMLRRYTYIKRKVGLKPRAANIQKVSKKLRSLKEIYHQEVRPKFLKENPKCQAGLKDLCTHKTTEIHHKKGRIGKLLIAVKYFLATCRPCHDWVEAHPKEAKKMGLSISRLKKDVVSSELTGVNSEETPSIDNTY